ncbi:hypothetical protein RRG08_060475 [Elysia crispata]|uniref:Uncharacterized protein n=1 Tax=Elysia crispata TaxID=231223 RepID=A0AAE1E7J0_9GAST|nr:hypothetical protein RRG08_060475 [Elysia crispata]
MRRVTFIRLGQVHPSYGPLQLLIGWDAVRHYLANQVPICVEILHEGFDIPTTQEKEWLEQTHLHHYNDQAEVERGSYGVVRRALYTLDHLVPPPDHAKLGVYLEPSHQLRAELTRSHLVDRRSSEPETKGLRSFELMCSTLLNFMASRQALQCNLRTTGGAASQLAGTHRASRTRISSFRPWTSSYFLSSALIPHSDRHLWWAGLKKLFL